MANLYDLANGFEKEVRVHPEYVALKAAFTELIANEEATKLFNDFRDTQMRLQSMQAMGQEIPQTDMEQGEAIFTAVQQNVLLMKVLEAEEKFAITMNELNQIIMKPVQELYGGQ